MEEDPLSPDQQIELVCELAQQAFLTKSQSLESQLTQITQAQAEQDTILAQQATRRETLSFQLHDLRRALQDLALRTQAGERDVERLAEQKRQLSDFKSLLLRTVTASREERPWDSYLTEGKADVFSVTQDLKAQLSSEEYHKVTTELRRMTSREQSKAETIAKLRVVLRDHESALSALQGVLEDS
jgi:hypothetical protein